MGDYYWGSTALMLFLLFLCLILIKANRWLDARIESQIQEINELDKEFKRLLDELDSINEGS